MQDQDELDHQVARLFQDERDHLIDVRPLPSASSSRPPNALPTTAPGYVPSPGGTMHVSPIDEPYAGRYVADSPYQPSESSSSEDQTGL